MWYPVKTRVWVYVGPHTDYRNEEGCWLWNPSTGVARWRGGVPRLLGESGSPFEETEAQLLCDIMNLQQYGRVVI